jgi:hypothetical protein
MNRYPGERWTRARPDGWLGGVRATWIFKTTGLTLVTFTSSP